MDKNSLYGDLMIKVKITPDPNFTKKNMDIYSNEYLKIWQAVLGDEIKIKTINGEENYTIPSGF